jgi:hypothetical protein
MIEMASWFGSENRQVGKATFNARILSERGAFPPLHRLARGPDLIGTASTHKVRKAFEQSWTF